MPKFGAWNEVTKEHREMIRALFSVSYAAMLTVWEEEFLESIKFDFFLSKKQLDKLHTIFDDVTSGRRDDLNDYDDTDL